MTFPYDHMIPNDITELHPGMSIMVYSRNPDNRPDGILDIRNGNYYLVTRDGFIYNVPKSAILTKQMLELSI